MVLRVRAEGRGANGPIEVAGRVIGSAHVWKNIIIPGPVLCWPGWSSVAGVWDAVLVRCQGHTSKWVGPMGLVEAYGDCLRPVAYFSAKLDSVAAGLPSCLRAVAACEKAVAASRHIVGYTTVLLDMPNITVKRCTTLSPATLLPTAEDGHPHCCETALEQTCSPRPDTTDVPFSNPDFVFFTDGSSFKDTSGTNRVGFAVCTSVDTVSSGPLPSHYSAQAAELVALTEACKLAEGCSVTIYTDSRYAFGVVHDFGALWKHRKFLKSDGKPILNASLVANLLDAVLLPSAIAVVKCQAHQKDDSEVTQGNSRADAAARAAASMKPASSFLSQLFSGAPPASLPDTQSFATPDKRCIWASCGCAVDSSSVWRAADGRPCLPKHFFPWFAKLTYGIDHVSKGGMFEAIA
ncbi:uncharacterized protein LOC115433294 [Sphaeramia orbicularis]|uniref:uncharacterized protein LOC115433294 n=1 Tax=Sphaeramia orbicularis TaxID=375764 RepID=UPI0011807A40|nr:uncharacterized protein LOC115433294 [Sphaeramia orbicularis]